MGTCRLVIEQQPRSGAWNMAADEALLQNALERKECTVRWYRWETATLSLGYFQSAEDLRRHPRLAGLPTVRRLSGGGAILHHHEWTYSVVVPPGHPRAAHPGDLYELIHGAIVGALSHRRVIAGLRGDPEAANDHRFLCFGRGDSRDVILQGHKVTGSAQRRRRGAVLQHGSVLVRRSPFADEFPGICDLVPGTQLDLGFATQAGELCARLLGADSPTAEDLPATIEMRAAELVTKYRRLDWHRDSRNSVPTADP